MSMKILFLTLLDFNTINEPGIYTDLLREFVKHGDEVYIVSPVEARKNIKTHLIQEEHVVILKQKIGNVQKTNSLIEKGISTLTLEKKIIDGIKQYFNNVEFDLILYSTPPITLCGAIEYVKKRDNAKTYLMLKDIFPQNAVDLGMLSKHGVKGLIYKYFRYKEKKLYALSDKIGCMSKANVDYVLKNNREVDISKVECCPNCVEPIDMSISDDKKILIREKYGIPLDKKIFVYGGNLGKPQGILFLIECLRAANNTGAYFLIVGDGTEYDKLENYIKHDKPKHVKLMRRLPKDDYDAMVGSCDIGMIFLDHRFTIPNFPSRLLSYMQAKLPVLAVTDPNTDVGKIIVEGGFGWWCESNDVYKVKKCIDDILTVDSYKDMERNAIQYLNKNYNTTTVYKLIKKSYSNMETIL